MAIPLTVTVGGHDRTSIVQEDSIHTHDQLTSRNTAEIELRDDLLDGSLRPAVGQPIVILDTDGVTRLFAGTIDEVDEEYHSNQIPYLTYTLALVDFNQICDRFLVANSFISPTQTLSDIVNWILTNVLAGEGISNAGVQTGPVIPETKVFNYKTVTHVFNELQQLTNYVWSVDYNKVLNFFPRTGVSTTITLDQTNVISCKVKTSRAVGPYRNRQYVRAGTAETKLRTDFTTGDGQRRTFNTTYPVERGATKGTPPAITLNGVAQTVGIQGLDTGKQFYWTRGSNQVSIDDSASPPSTSDIISVTYIGRYPSIVQGQLDAEIAARAAIEGGTGVYESLKTDKNLNDIVAQRNLVNALLSRYGFIAQELTVVTDVVGIRSGMLIPCNYPPNNVSGTYLVQSVEGQSVGNSFMRYTVVLVNG